MRPTLLHLDAALDGQTALAQAMGARGGLSLDARRLGPALRLWSRPDGLAQLKAQVARDLPASLGPALVFSGSGDFHHITPILLARAVEALGDEAVTVVHFDNHPDWVTFANGAHCGSWVGWAARLPGVRKVLTVGVCSDDIVRPATKGADLDLVAEDRVELYAYTCGGAPTVEIGGQEWPTIETLGEQAFCDFLLGRIQTRCVYVTIDKDVLRTQDAGTNWDQGRTSLSFLKTMLSAVRANHQLIGADVVGDWSPAVYGGGILAGLLKRGEAMLDQPWRAPPPAVRVRNEMANLDLLNLLGAAA